MNKRNSEEANQLFSEEGIFAKNVGNKMTNRGNLRALIRATHKGIKYPCGQSLY